MNAAGLKPIETKADLLTAIRNARNVYVRVGVAGTDGFVKISRKEAAIHFGLYMRDDTRGDPLAFRSGADLYIGTDK